MPIIIEEMTVQVEVNQGGTGSAPTGGTAAGNNSAGSREIDTIRKTLEEVMEVIRHQKER